MKLLEKLRLNLWIQLTSMGTAIAGMIGLGTVAYHYLESWTWAQCFYFSVVTLTTVGYGDLHPTTDASRIFTAAYVLVGVGIMLAALTTIATTYLKMSEQRTMQTMEKRLRRKGKAPNEPDESGEDI